MRFHSSRILCTLTLGACCIGAAALPVSGQGTWETTLQARDINVDGKVDAYYDTVLNVTWLANADAPRYQYWATGAPVAAADGTLTAVEARSWVATLNVFGNTGWRLPIVNVTDPLGAVRNQYNGSDSFYNVRTISPDGTKVYSEFAHLFYVTLGNRSDCDTVGNCEEVERGRFVNTGPFENLGGLNNGYWHLEGNLPEGYLGGREEPFWYRWWAFGNFHGDQQQTGIGDRLLAVRSGDVVITGPSPVPEPQTYLSMLLGLALLARLKRSRH
jgi:hypothetical protein